MNAKKLRPIAAIVFAGAALTASAETYFGRIYSVPAGYDWMYAIGAGNNGVMSGYGKLTANGQEQALYLTQQGTKNMHPAGWASSRITDSWATYHTGFGAPVGTIPTHALFWVGGGTPVDLHPGGIWLSSVAIGGGGQIQVGSVANFSGSSACMWSRTASSHSLLNASAHSNTAAYGTDGVRQVGEGTNGNNEKNALLWTGPGSFATNLHPAGYTESLAVTIDGNQQGGWAAGPASGNQRHAILWNNTAGSFVDLNPNGVFQETAITRVRGGLQVGTGIPISTPTRKQAIAWHGTSGSWINLHFKLPYPFTFWSSAASDIDNNGNITGTIESPDGTIRRPVIWIRQ